jgi:predicted negative regulator of RcsB-dependent stress response
MGIEDDIKTVQEDIAKVKTFWTDYRLYIVCTACLILGLILGHKVHI